MRTRTSRWILLDKRERVYFAEVVGIYANALTGIAGQKCAAQPPSERPSDFTLLAKDLGMGVRRMRKICSSLAEPSGEALLRAGEDGADVIETLPYSAEDVLEDARPRLEVVGAFASGAGR